VKNTLRFFGVMDVVSILLLTSQIVMLLTHFDQLQANASVYIISILRILLYVSLFVSAAGCLLFKRFGILTYYIQFIFRFITLILTFGFVTYATEFIGNGQTALKYTLTLAIFGEFLRIYLTRRIQQRYF